MPGLPRCFLGNSDEDLLKACKASRLGGGTDDLSVIVLASGD